MGNILLMMALAGTPVPEHNGCTAVDAADTLEHATPSGCARQDDSPNWPAPNMVRNAGVLLVLLACPMVLVGSAGLLLAARSPAIASAATKSSSNNSPCACGQLFCLNLERAVCGFCCGQPSACAFRLCGLGFQQALQCGLFNACVQTCLLCAFAAV